jgi:hypothetical protein
MFPHHAQLGQIHHAMQSPKSPINTIVTGSTDRLSMAQK